MNQHFAYAIDNRYLPVLVPFGLRRTKDGVTLTDDAFLATFGFFKLATQLTISPARTLPGTTVGGPRSVCAGHVLMTD